jgi:hypothetical protein
MPTWILLAEYLPLFALLTGGYIFNGHKMRRNRSAMEFGRKNKEMMGVS